jgi:hypothetical protein
MVSNLAQNWTWKTTVIEKHEEKHKKDEKDVHVLSPPGWLTRRRGEERRKEKRREEMKLLSSLLSFCRAQVLEELCKGVDEKERKESER